MKNQSQASTVIGIDLGPTSLGWSVIREHESGFTVVKAGVRVFDDGRENKTKDPLNLKRRTKRGERRQRDRRLLRKEHLRNELVRLGFSPLPLSHFDKATIYHLRNKALTQPVTKSELANICLHLCNKRGFRSNRKADKAEASGDIINNIANLKKSLAENGFKTLGQYLHYRLQQSMVKAEPNTKTAGLAFKSDSTQKVAGDPHFNYYPSRELIESEFNEIMQFQMAQGVIEPKAVETLRSIIFHQRKLLSQYSVIKDCELENEKVIPKASPYFQLFRLLQTVNNLSIECGDSAYNESVRGLILTWLKGQFSHTKELKLVEVQSNQSAVLSNRELKKLIKQQYPSIDSDAIVVRGLSSNEKKITLNELVGFIEKLGLSACSIEQQHACVQLFFTPKAVKGKFVEYEPEELHSLLNQWLVVNGLSSVSAEVFNQLEAMIPSDYANFSLTAIKNLLPFMEAGQATNQAKKSYFDQTGVASYSPKLSITQQAYLPYYGKVLPHITQPIMRAIDRNPIILNKGTPQEQQLYRVNECELAYGRIANPTVHIALNQLRKVVNKLIQVYGKPDAIKVELFRELKLNKKQKDVIKKRQTEQEKQNQEAKTKGYESRVDQKRYSLHKQQEGKCLYCNQPIQVIGNSEVDHIIPFSVSFDDSFRNLALACRECNRAKQNRAPKEWLSREAFEVMLQRARELKLLASKQDCLKYESSPENEVRLLNRARNDTAYISKIAAQYLQVVCSNVSTTKGGLTHLVRRALNLNSLLDFNTQEKEGEGEKEKNRQNHRHHALDATIIAMTNPRLMQFAAVFNTQSREAKEAWFAKSKEEKLAYFASKGVSFNADELAEVLKNMLISHKLDRPNINYLRQRGQTAGQLHEETNESPKKVKLTPAMIPLYIKGKEKTPENIYRYVTSGNNYCAEVYQYTPKGKQQVKYGIEIISNFNAHQKDFKTDWRKDYPEAKLIMRLFIHDTVRVNGVCYRVSKMSGSNINCVHLDTVLSYDHARKENKFIDLNAKRFATQTVHKVYIDEIGKVYAPMDQHQSTPPETQH